jgi:HEAT repeat protein
MKRGCLVALTIALGLAFGTAWVVYYHFKNQFDPVYYDKRIHMWADEAVWDESPARRQEAVQVLLEALDDLEGEPRTQLLLSFLNPTRGNEEKTTLPSELLPFLVKGLKVERRSGYPAKALRRIPTADSVPVLLDLLSNDASSEVREQVVRILGGLVLEKKVGEAKEMVITGLREAIQDADPAVRKAAGEYSKWIEAQNNSQKGRAKP